MKMHPEITFQKIHWRKADESLRSLQPGGMVNDNSSRLQNR